MAIRFHLLCLPLLMALFSFAGAQEASTKAEEELQKTNQLKSEAQAWKQKAAQFLQDKSNAPAETKRLQSDLKTSVPRAEISTTPSFNEIRRALTTVRDPQAAQVENNSISAIEAILTERVNSLEILRKELNQLEIAPKTRSARQMERAGLKSRAEAHLGEIKKELSTPSTETLSASVAEAHMGRLQAEKETLESELQALAAESEYDEVSGELTTLRRDKAIREGRRLEQVVELWGKVAAMRRTNQVEAARLEAVQVREKIAGRFPEAASVAEENTRLAEERQDLAVKLQSYSETNKQLGKQLTLIRTQFTNIRKKAEISGLSDSIGLFLRNQRRILPSSRRLRKALSGHQEETGQVHLTLLERQEERAALADPEEVVRELGARQSPDSEQAIDPELNKVLLLIFQKRKELLEQLQTDYETYLKSLVDIVEIETDLIQISGEYSAYIDERVLWIRSTAPIGKNTFKDAGEALAWISRGESWKSLALGLVEDIKEHQAVYVLLVLMFIPLIVLEGRGRSRIVPLGDQVRRNVLAPFPLTMRALGYTILLSSVLPFLVWLVSTRISQMPGGDQNFNGAVARGLLWMSWCFLLVNFVSQCCRPVGLMDAHFNRPQEMLRHLRKHLRWTRMILALVVFTTASLEYSTVEESFKGSLGRLSFLAGLLALSAFFHALLRCSTRNPTRLGRLAHVIGVGSPLILMAVSASGYHYASLQLASRLIVCLIGVFLLMLGHAFLSRWLLNAQVRGTIRSMRTDSELADPDAAIEAYAEDLLLKAPVLSSWARRILRNSFYFAGSIGLIVIWLDLVPALGILDRVTLWNSTEHVTQMVQQPDGSTVQESRERTVPITLWNLLLAVIFLVVTFLATQNLPEFLDVVALRRLPMEAGVRYAIMTITSYMIALLGVMLACSVLGIGWDAVQWLLAGMSVGLGFGLQEIFANFVSGLIILFERPVRVGDIITVGETTGTVSRIRIRATTIIDWNRKELIVPNKEFITGRLMNWSLSDPITRLVFPVGIAYGSDTRRARELLMQAAKTCPVILSDPGPTVLFKGFGESTLDLDLRVFIPSMDAYSEALNTINTSIDDTFKEAGLEIAFPQRDLHIRSVEPLIRTRRESAVEDPGCVETDSCD